MRQYEVWRDGESRDNASQIDAMDHEHAAEEWADESDRDTADYAIVGGEEPIVCVALLGDDEVRRFRVRGEAVPSYSATEVVD